MSSVPSMPVQTRTPRKRKAVEAPLSPPSTRRKRTGAAPAPNPPLVPFPPTPTSRHRTKGEDFDPDATPRGSASAAFATAKPRVKLPDHLQTLLTLHHAFNIAISLHLATQPPVLPPHSADATSVRVPNLTNLLTLKGAVERGSGRRFGQTELARLAWLYAWDGESLPKEDKEDDNPFLDKPKVNPSEPVSGLSYLITATRTLDSAGRKVHTLGIGLELDIEAGETRQLLLGGAEGGFGNKGQGGGLRVLGRWNAGAELREDIVRSRLEKWVTLNGGELETVEDTGLPTPSTRDSGRSAIPPIPLLPLPKLASANLGAALFAASPSAESGPSTPKPPAFATELSDPFEMPAKPATPKGSLEARRQALRDRIQAKSASARAARTPLSASIRSSMESLSRAQQQEELQRRSTLSRLEPIAESVWMMFSGPSSGPLSLSPGGGFSPVRRRKAIPLSEALERLVKSAKSPLSAAEAETSVRMLADLCPFFLAVKLVGKQEWIEMPSVQMPSSPGSLGVAAAETAATMAANVLSSPTRSPRTPRALSGPASPGRVQVGGLRAVRERIRRELGE